MFHGVRALMAPSSFSTLPALFTKLGILLKGGGEKWMKLNNLLNLIFKCYILDLILAQLGFPYFYNIYTECDKLGYFRVKTHKSN